MWFESKQILLLNMFFAQLTNNIADLFFSMCPILKVESFDYVVGEIVNSKYRSREP